MIFIFKFKNGKIDITMMIKQLDLLMPLDMATPLKETSITCANERKFI